MQITIPVGAEREAREFYCSFLGFSEIEKPEALKGRGGFWLACDLPIHIGVENDLDRSKSKAHVAYTVDDLERWRRKLIERGIIPTDGIQIPDFRRFEFRDPFGNRVEFLQNEPL
ncbi:MAG TPA: VOC family protein [Pyrinomonadaceae bacterium]|nr:VOC family protein [Pyrinomonadaceae bacterium]